MTNLEIYEKYKEVPATALKEFDNGRFKGTDINSMWRIKVLTKEFGACGFGWFYDIVKEWTENAGEEVLAFAEIKLYVKVENEWSKGISATGGSTLYKLTSKGMKSNDEAYKMAITDAIGVACKQLGIGADVYWQDDRTKYTSVEKEDVFETKEVDIQGGNYVMKSGKHKGKTLNEIYKEDYQYVDWLSMNANGVELKQNARACLLEHGVVVTDEV